MQYYIVVLTIRLWQFHTFVNIIKETKSTQKFVSAAKFYKKMSYFRYFIYFQM